MEHGHSEVMLNDSCKEMFLLFIYLLQVYTETYATALKRSAIVVYQKDMIILNITYTFKSFSIDKLYTLVGCIPV